MRVSQESETGRVGSLMRQAVGEIRKEYPAVEGLYSQVNTAGDIEIFESDEKGLPVGNALKIVKVTL